MNPCCTRCYELYTETNPARILVRCSHTYCTNCISTMPFCPMDKLPVDFNRFKLDGFRINTTLMRDIIKQPAVTPIRRSSQWQTPTVSTKITPIQPTPQPQREEQTNRCLLHDKPLDLVCIDHLKRVCSGCALFGDHKLHKVETVEKVVSECEKVAQHALNILAEVDAKNQKLNQEALQDCISGGLREKRDTMVKNIRTKFRKLNEKLKKLEVQAINKLDKLVEQHREQLCVQLKFEGMFSKRAAWINQANKLIDLVETLTVDRMVEDASRYLNESCNEHGVSQRGDYLLVEISSFETNFSNKLNRFQQDISCDFDDSLEEKLDSYANVYLQSDKEVKKMQEKKQEEYLLEEGLTIIKRTEQGLTPDTCSTICNIQRLMTEELEAVPQTQPFAKEQPIIVRQVPPEPPLLSKDSTVISNDALRRKKKIKIPQKYQQVVEDLRLDRCQTIDLGGAQLGDAIVVLLCDYIRCSQRLRTLKLVRNKLNNQCLVPIIQACNQCNVSSLNLGQNFMTDRAIQILEKMPTKQLKAITLSQNKITSRIAKTKPLQFKKRGIVLSI